MEDNSIDGEINKLARELQSMHYLINSENQQKSVYQKALEMVKYLAPVTVVVGGSFLAGAGYADQNLLALIPVTFILGVVATK